MTEFLFVFPLPVEKELFSLGKGGGKYYIDIKVDKVCKLTTDTLLKPLGLDLVFQQRECVIPDCQLSSARTKGCPHLIYGGELGRMGGGQGNRGRVNCIY